MVVLSIFYKFDSHVVVELFMNRFHLVSSFDAAKHTKSHVPGKSCWLSLLGVVKISVGGLDSVDCRRCQHQELILEGSGVEVSRRLS